jgi:hypothetical protein
MKIFFIILAILGLSNYSTEPLNSKQLKQEDFNISYNSKLINDKVSADQIESMLGLGEDFEANNNGFISGDGSSTRWQADYPNSSNTDLRLVFLTTDKETYLVFAQLNTLETSRGIKAGDSYDKLIKTYGEPQLKFVPYKGAETLRYNYENKYIDFVFNNETRTIQYITIDYNSYRADKEQKFEEQE